MHGLAARRIPILLVGYLLLLAVIVFMADTSTGTEVWSFIHTLPGGDKVGHFLLFGMLSLIVNLMVAGRWSHSNATGIVCLGVLLEELSQIYLPSRQFDLWDMVADAAGIFFFAWLAVAWSARRRSSLEC